MLNVIKKMLNVYVSSPSVSFVLLFEWASKKYPPEVQHICLVKFQVDEGMDGGVSESRTEETKCALLNEDNWQS